MAKLIFVGEKFAGRVYEFTAPKTTVGRGDHNTLTIHDASVSLNHCEIYAYGSEVIVHDLGSRNGTCVNGERLHKQQRPLAPGQTVKFGSIEARLEAPRSAAHEASLDTDVTAFHAYARLRNQPIEPKQSVPSGLTLDDGLESAPTDHTLMLPRSSESEKAPVAAPAPAALPADKVSNASRIAVGLGLAAVVAAIILWLVLGRN